MTTIQDQYTEFAKRGQDATTAVVEAWTRTFQEASTKLPSFNPTDAHQAISDAVDQVFDFAAKVIDVQRDFAKQLISTSATVADEVSERAAAAVTEVTETASKATPRTRTARKSA